MSTITTTEGTEIFFKDCMDHYADDLADYQRRPPCLPAVLTDWGARRTQPRSDR